METFGKEFISFLSSTLGKRAYARTDHHGNIIGYHIFLKNGMVFSIAFGPGTYSDNYNEWEDFTASNLDKDYTSTTRAEIAVWTSRNMTELLPLHGDSVEGYLPPLTVINRIETVEALDSSLETEFNIPFGGSK